MKLVTHFVFILYLFCSSFSFCQNFPQWGNLKKGKFEVGYKDTVVFKENEKFKYFNYSDNKPFFISVWYPAIENTSIPFMEFSEYFDLPNLKTESILKDSLIFLEKRVFVKDAICTDFNNNDISYDSLHKKLFEDVLKTKVCAKRNLLIQKNKFPCVIYHHGSQSVSFDNNVMCEYLASMGFIVISSIYNLPDEKNSGWLIPSTDTTFDFTSDFDFVLKTAKTFQHIDTTKMIAIGHSAGAQIEMIYENNYSNKSFKKIISLHTTLENVSIENARNWTNLNFILDNKCKLSTTPIDIIAPTNKATVVDVNDSTGVETVYDIELYPKFLPFKQNRTTPYKFVTIKYPLRHDSFISLGNLRFSQFKKYQFEDKDEIQKQQFYYEKIVNYLYKVCLNEFGFQPKETYSDLNVFFIIENHN